jgi:hypothetical protein
MASGILAIYLLNFDIWRTVRGLVIAAVAAAVTSTPFFYQRLHELPDVTRRWGVFSLTRHQFVLFTPLRLFVILALVLLAMLAYCFRSPAETRSRVRAAAGVMSVVLVVSALAGPLWLFLVNKDIQVVHHNMAAEMTAGYAVLVLAGWILEELRVRTRVLSLGPARRFATGVLFAGCLGIVVFRSHQSLGQAWWGRGQPAVEYPPNRFRIDRTDEDGYRASFRELHETLARPEWKQAEVMGTFDGEVANWWEYRGKHLYLPDLFNTTVPDGEVEGRVFSFMHTLAATPEDFSHALDNWYFLFRVLVGAKYQANRVYTPWPLQDYSPASRSRIGRLDLRTETVPELPEPERARLMEAYTHFDPMQQPPRRLDLVVLSAGNLRQFVHPERTNCELLWKNRVFEIWAPPTWSAVPSR